MGKAGNKSDGNKTKDGEGKRKKFTDKGYYLPPPSSVIIKVALSPPPRVQRHPRTTWDSGRKGDLSLCLKKKKKKNLREENLRENCLTENVFHGGTLLH